MARRALEVDPLVSWARRTPEGDVEVRLVVGPGELPDPGAAEIRLRAGGRTADVPATVTTDGGISFTVPGAGLGRRTWQVVLRQGAGQAGEQGPTKLDARLVAVSNRPVALLTGPVPTSSMPPPRPQRNGPPRKRAATPPARARRVLGHGVRRARALRSRALRRATSGGGSGGSRGGSRGGGDKADGGRDRGPRRAVSPPDRESGTVSIDAEARSGGARPRLKPDGSLNAPMRLLDHSRWERALVLGAVATSDAVVGWASRLSPAEVRVVMVADDGAPEVAALRGAGLDVVCARDAASVLDQLRRTRSLDVVVSTLSEVPGDPGGPPVAVPPLALPYLRRGGSLLEDRRAEPSGSADDEDAGPGPLPAWTASLHSAPGRERRRESQDRASEMRDSLGSLVATPDLVVVTNRRRHYYKLREEDVEEILPLREPDLEVAVVASRPAGSFTPATTEQSHGPRREDSWPSRVSHPAMTLRHYRGEISSGGGMLLFSGGTILPESFRWPHAATLGNSRCLSSDEVARIKPRWVPEERLPGAYFHLDGAYSGHFGHYATETLARLWAWDEAKQQVPDLKAFVHVRPDDPGGGVMETTFLRAYGIAEDDIALVDRPVQLQEVLGASPMWQNTDPFYVHPDLREVWDRLSAGMLRDVETSASDRHERIFVARGAEYSHRRGCRNSAEVESLFAEHGFHVFCPEDLTLTEQAALFAGARVVAGYGGSAMANLMHSRRLEALVVLSHNGYDARNEHLYMSLLGGDFHYFWAEADVEPPAEGRTLESFRSSWELDLETYGDELRAVLGGY